MKTTTTLFAALLVLASIGSAAAYDFNITNSTKSKITKVEATEDGKTWGQFDVGKGLAPGASMKITWSEQTDNSGCEWKVKATFADGSESEPETFDFCEEDLEIEFSE
jgi:hypothetical protein